MQISQNIKSINKPVIKYILNHLVFKFAKTVHVIIVILAAPTIKYYISLQVSGKASIGNWF